MIIGSLDTIVFSVSSNTVKTFKDMSRSSSARIEHHMPINGNPVAEFIGPDVKTISFNIELKEQLNVDVLRSIENLREKQDLGWVCSLILGIDYLGDWLISNIEESYSQYNKQGKIISAELSITLTSGV